jgi:murein endopeptidase
MDGTVIGERARPIALLVAICAPGCALPGATRTEPRAALAAVRTSTPAEAAARAKVETPPPPRIAETSTAASPSAAIDEDEEEDEGAPEEEESRQAVLLPPGAPTLQYTADLSDEELAKHWHDAPETLGTISIGFADEGRMINALQCPAGDGSAWTLVTPENAWGTSETIAYLIAAAERTKRLHPDALPLRINNISAREGGYLRPHRSHQNGRDVDLGFYYPTPNPSRSREREKLMDVALNWELIKSLVLLTDVQVILVDKRVQKVLYEHALRIGEDAAWLDSLFRAGRDSLIQHARRHRDHFHVRFFSPRSQELGRRVAPLLAQRPEHNLAMHRVRNGDTLGAIAFRYRSSVKAIQKANHMKSTFLRIAQVLKIPLRGPCTQCPVPPAFQLPARRLPPKPPIELTSATAGTSTASAGVSAATR